MTLDEAMPLVSATAQLVEQLVLKILDSAHMTDEEKQKAIDLLGAQLDATADKVENVRFDAKPKG